MCIRDSFTKDDKPFTGTSIRNHSNGKIGARYQFVDGIFDGIIEEWYENGQRSAYKMYKEGMRHGITTYWDEKGKPTKQVLYENDEEVERKKKEVYSITTKNLESYKFVAPFTLATLSISTLCLYMS